MEPRVLLRALCPTRPGQLRVLGEEKTFWERFDRARRGVSGPATSVLEPVDRRCEGFAGVAGDLFRSGESVLVVVADVSRRRRGLEEIVAGLAPQAMPVASWSAVQADPGLASAFDHLVALDPPPGGRSDPLLRIGPQAHIAWGPAEAEFALLVYRANIDLRPALADAYRALRDLPPGATRDLIQDALCGAGRYARSPELCARLALVLGELELVDISLQEPTFAYTLPLASSSRAPRPTAFRCCV